LRAADVEAVEDVSAGLSRKSPSFRREPRGNAPEKRHFYEIEDARLVMLVVKIGHRNDV
jgi:hypothetical protein